MKGNRGIRTEEMKKRISQALLGRKRSLESIKKQVETVTGNKSSARSLGLKKAHRCKNFGFSKGIIPWNKNKGKIKKMGIVAYARKYRHQKGISKKYISKYGGVKIPTKVYRQRYKALLRAGGFLTTATIQRVYEDNIKQYGTLTCYLCLEPIPFGKDHLEHKISLFHGGTNKYENLGVACQGCNCEKNKKSEREYKRWKINKENKKMGEQSLLKGILKGISGILKEADGVEDSTVLHAHIKSAKCMVDGLIDEMKDPLVPLELTVDDDKKIPEPLSPGGQQAKDELT